MSHRVLLYRTRFCGYCVPAEWLLRQRGIPLQSIDVGGDAQKRAWLRDTTGRHTVPQIFIDGQPIGGCSELMELDESGRLEAMLANSPPA